MKESMKYVVTAIVAIAVIVALSLVVKSGNDRFSQTLENLNGTLTTQADPGAVQPNPSQGSNTVNVQLGSDVVVNTNPAQGQPEQTQPVTNIPAPPVSDPASAPSGDVAASDAPAVQQPTGGAPATIGNNPETLAYLNNAVNTMRKMQNFTATKDQDIRISVTDCSLPAFTSIINGVVESMVGTESFTYTFANGYATDPEEGTQVTAMTAIPPTDIDFNLMADGIASVTSTSDGTNTTYTIVLKAESTTVDNAIPYYHGATMDCFDITSLDIPITITEASFNYPGATIDITIDAQGRIVKYHEHMPLNGVGGGKMGFMSAQATLEGYLDETWTIQY